MNKLIVSNWKMNPQTVAEAVNLARASDIAGLLICPPFPFLEVVRKVLKNAELGAQDLPPERVAGVRYAIIGHSSRRKLGETDEVVAQKVAAAVRQDITPIVCVGETRAEHDAGKSREVVERQLTIGLGQVTRDKGHGTKKSTSLIIAYEPVWAISIEPDAKPDTPENAVAMIRFMKEILVASGYTLVAKFIYGGSVTPANAKAFLKEKNIEGALVGGASLVPENIRKIAEIASHA